MQPKTLSPTQRFWRLLKPDQKEITNVYIYAVGIGLVNLSLPLGIQAIVNLIQGGQVSMAWIVLIGIVVLGVALSGIFQIFQLRIMEHLQQNIFTRAAFEFAYRIPRLKIESLYRHYAPELVNRFFDTVSVQKGLSKILIDFSSASIQVVFGLLLLAFYHPFFIGFNLVLIVVVILLIRLSVRRGLNTSLAESRSKYAVAYWLEEVARTATTFKLSGDSPLPLRRVNTLVGDYLTSRNAHFNILIKHYSLLVFFKVLVATGLLAIGGVLVMAQNMNIGQFVAAEIIILLIMSSIEKLVMSIETVYDVLTSLEKIGQVTDMELEKIDGKSVVKPDEWKGLNIEFKDVSFTYPDLVKPTLNNVNLQIEAGERVAIVGKNGSGKSSLLHLISTLYRPQTGTVLYDGVNMKRLNMSDLQSVIGDCLSNEQLFEGTLLDNITMGRPQATEESVNWAISNLGLEEFVKDQEDGLDTYIDPQGRKLPRSIVQKLILARSIVDKPRLLLLEDAFEHLDNRERKRIVDFLFDPEKPWTIVAVSSWDYLVDRADRMILLEDGMAKSTELALASYQY